MCRANVLSDVSGVTGQAIIKAILTGERDPRQLAAFRDPRVKASEEEIAQVWRGTGKRICCLCSSRNRRATSFSRSRSPPAMGNWNSIFRKDPTGALGQFAEREAEGAAAEEGE